MTIGYEKLPKNIKWCPPKKGMVKINIDTTFNSTNKAIGLRVLYIDGEGRILRAAPE